MLTESVVVQRHEDFGGGYRILELEAPEIAGQALPGQFVHVRIPALDEAALRRPFSIYKAESGRLSILYKTVGTGTAALVRSDVGDTLSLIGPLGHGFPDVSEGRFPLFVAGGYGVAPLSFLAKRSDVKGAAFLGARTAGDIFCIEDFEDAGWEVAVATEDGSLGDQGLVTQVLDDWLAEHLAGNAGEPLVPEFFACGPGGLLQAVADRALPKDWQAWLSLDKHMGCGVGACLACVQKVKAPDGSVTWARGCREGPVFDARVVVWGDDD